MKLPDFESEYKSLFDAIRKVVPPSMKIYLVGGAVRDIVLGRKIRDFDFCVEGLVRPIGKHIANELGGAYYVLDDEREMVRVVFVDVQKGPFDIDIALICGDSIEDDLRERDFCFNAMAIEIGGDPVLIDPLNGYQDLEEKRLRMCSPDSLKNDPMRALRAIRMSLEFGLEMDDELAAAMSEVPARLSESSIERYRDELFKIIRLYQNGKAVELYEQYDFLNHLFPGYDVERTTHDIDWIRNTDKFAVTMTEGKIPEEFTDDFSQFALTRLGNYQQTLREFFDKSLALYHNRMMLTSLTSILKCLTDDRGTIKKWCNRLTLSGAETGFVLSISDSHELLKSVNINTEISDIEIYRYFRKFKDAGIAGGILFLSEAYALQDIPHAYKDWCDKVVIVQNLIEAYFTRYMDVIDPVPLLSGHDIQEVLLVPAGPMIGFVKNALIEAQIKGAVKNLAEAESFVKQQAKHYQET